MSNNKPLGKLRPVLFNTAMVQAIFGDRKTQTRRLVKDKDILPATNERHFIITDGEYNVIRSKCPYGKIGDVLWVRETHFYVSRDHAHDLLEGNRDGSQWVYKTSFHHDWFQYAKEKYGYKWKPSIHMPFDACRLFLQITNIRIERLQDISESDAIHEGIAQFSKDNTVYKYGLDGWPWQEMQRKPSLGFSVLWKSINGSESWDANPWVWVIEFKQITKDKAMSCTMKNHEGGEQ